MTIADRQNAFCHHTAVIEEGREDGGERRRARERENARTGSLILDAIDALGERVEENYDKIEVWSNSNSPLLPLIIIGCTIIGCS